MSEDYVEDTHGDINSEVGSTSDHSAFMELVDFVWEDALEEICRFENFCVDMTFTRKSMFSFSQSLLISMAKRLLDKVSIETNPSSKADDPDCAKDRPTGLDMDAKQSSDVNVTVRSRASNRVEQETVESGNEDFGSSMQRIGSSLLETRESDHKDELEPTTND